jgi:hypothetical protein
LLLLLLLLLSCLPLLRRGLSIPSPSGTSPVPDTIGTQVYSTEITTEVRTSSSCKICGTHATLHKQRSAQSTTGARFLSVCLSLCLSDSLLLSLSPVSASFARGWCPAALCAKVPPHLLLVLYVLLPLLQVIIEIPWFVIAQNPGRYLISISRARKRALYTLQVRGAAARKPGANHPPCCEADCAC